jgi:hypothetical protein
MFSLSLSPIPYFLSSPQGENTESWANYGNWSFKILNRTEGSNKLDLSTILQQWSAQMVRANQTLWMRLVSYLELRRDIWGRISSAIYCTERMEQNLWLKRKRMWSWCMSSVKMRLVVGESLSLPCLLASLLLDNAWTCDILKQVDGYDDKDEITFRRSISPKGEGSYHLNGKEVTWTEYEEQLQSIGILVKARNFLVFQGDVESISTKSPQVTNSVR